MVAEGDARVGDDDRTRPATAGRQRTRLATAIASLACAAALAARAAAAATTSPTPLGRAAGLDVDLRPGDLRRRGTATAADRQQRPAAGADERPWHPERPGGQDGPRPTGLAGRRADRRSAGVRRGERRLAAARARASAPATPRPSPPTRASSRWWGRSPRPAWGRCCPPSTGRQAGCCPIIGMSSTYLGLTRAGPGVVAGHPDALYPTGERSFVRVVPADDVQGAAGALYAQRLGVRRPYVLRSRRGVGCRRGHGLRHGGDAPGHERRRHG